VVAHHYGFEPRRFAVDGGYRHYFNCRVSRVSAEYLGKFTTAFQIILVFAIVLAEAYPNLQLASANRALIYLVAALTTFLDFTIRFRLLETQFLNFLIPNFKPALAWVHQRNN